MSILEVKNLSHTFGDKRLFNNAEMSLFGGDRMGLTGLNGAGKSTFINILSGELIPDQGEVRFNPKIKLGYLDQQAKIQGGQSVRDYLRTAFAAMDAMAAELDAINEQISTCTDDTELLRLCQRAGYRQEYLESNSYYAINSTIVKVAAGLGIIAFGMDTDIAKLSGGQRAKVLLAKLLLESPDVLLLDEPTNFLDHDHIDWLGKYLSTFKGSFILVSHDFTFLSRVVNCIVDIEFGIMARYNGDYESFMKQKEARRTQYEKDYESQQKEIQRLEDYIARNKARASTAAMARSRQKQLDRIEVMDRPPDVSKPTFLFKYTAPVGRKLLTVKKLSVGYTQALLPDITMSLNLGEKLAITGFNGIGKSTLIKTLCGLIPPMSGNYKYADKLKIGYYEQEHQWPEPSLTPIQEIKRLYPHLTDKEIRSHLARCGVKGAMAMQGLSTLSGGEQSKVKIARLVLSPANLLVLDEPTNHLDVNAIGQLKEAVSAFEGSVIFVSHSAAFCDAVATRKLELEELFE